MRNRIAKALAQALVIGVWLNELGRLESIRGRGLGPELSWQLYAVVALLLFTWASGSSRWRDGEELTLFQRLRNLALAAAAWPVLADLGGDDVQRKRVVVIAAGLVFHVAVVAPAIRWVAGLAARRRVVAAGALTLGALALLAYAMFGEGDVSIPRPAPALAAPLTRNLVLISVDTTRADALHCYGNEVAETPSIDALAASGVLFEQAIAQAPHTHGSMAALLTAKYSIEHHSVALDPTLGPQHDTLALQLWSAGYLTAAFLDNPWLTPEFGFDLGYEHFEEGPPMPGALGWLVENATERFFLHVHFLDPHGPYEPRSPWIDELDPEYDGKWTRVGSDFLELSEEPGRAALTPEELERFDALYASEVSAMDAEIGRLLDELEKLDIADETVVVFLADHGEEFLDHGALNHSHTLHEELVHVPLLVRAPGDQSPGSRVPRPVELVDVTPTILELLGLPPLPGARGESFCALLTDSDSGSVAGAPSYCVSQRYGIKGRNLISIRDERWKLQIALAQTGRDRFLDWDVRAVEGREFTRRNRYRLYDLSADPGEQRDVFETEPAEATRLIEALEAWRESNDPCEPLTNPGARPGAGISAGKARQLRALGYLGEE